MQTAGRIAIVMLAASGTSAGCPGLAPYACVGDSDCDRGGRAGVCLDDRVCAYEDGDCPSGLRRSPNASVDAGVCVPPDDPGDTGPVPDTSSTSTASTGEATTTGPQPGDCGWRLPVVVDTAVLTPSEGAEGYPLLLSVHAPGLTAAIESSGEDPFVTDADGVPLPHEWERIDPATGAVDGWVRLPTYAAGEPVSLFVWAGLPAPPGDPALVWADTWIGVWHLGDALTGTDDDAIRNSARPDEPGFTAGQMQPEQSVPGVVGGALLFDGDDDVVTIDASFVGQLQSFTLSLWARYEGRGVIYSSYFQRLNGDGLYPRCWRLDDENGGGTTFCQYELDDGIHSLGTNLEHEVGELIHLVLRRDADANVMQVYVDGELVRENEDAPGELPDDGRAFELGHGEWGAYSGMLDELRVSDRALPPAFFDADFRTHRNPSSVLLEVGPLAPAPCDGA